MLPNEKNNHILKFIFVMKIYVNQRQIGHSLFEINLLQSNHPDLVGKKSPNIDHLEKLENYLKWPSGNFSFQARSR